MIHHWLSGIMVWSMAMAAAPSAAQTVSYDLLTGRHRYNNRIKDAATPLKRAWDAPDPDGRTLRVAYMIGSSRCYDGDAVTGQKWFDWMLNRLRRDMSPSDTAIVAERRRNCAGAPWLAPDAYFEQRRTVWQGELLYTSTDSKALAKPIQILDPDRKPAGIAPPAPINDPVAAAHRAEKVAALMRPAADLKKNCSWKGPARAQNIGRYSFISRQIFQPAYLAQVRTRLDVYLDTLQADYGMALPNRVITIILAKCADELPEIANSVHNLAIDPSQNIGYSVKEDLTVVAVLDRWMQVSFKPADSEFENDTQLRRTLRHELFHLVAHHGFIDMPEWLDEGLAQYFAVAGVRNQSLPGVTAWPDSWPIDPALASVFSDTGEAAAPATGTKVANLMMQVDLARMFMAYADAQKQLAPLIAALRKRDPADFQLPGQSDLAIVERVFGRPLSDIEKQVNTQSLICRYHADKASWQWVAGVDPRCKDSDKTGLQPTASGQ